MLISLQIFLEISNKQLYFCEVKNNAKLQNIPIRYSHQMFLKFHRWRSCQKAALCSVLCSGVVVLYLGELRNLSFSSFCTVCTNYGTLVVVLFAQILLNAVSIVRDFASLSHSFCKKQRFSYILQDFLSGFGI